MAGNELEIAKYLFKNINNISLNHLGVINEIGLPTNKKKQYKILKNDEELNKLITNESRKKADIYLNGIGVSMKQTGACFPYNRAQRADLQAFLEQFNIENIEQKIKLFDTEINKFHNSITEGRNKDWELFFDKLEFQKICKYLMMDGSPQKVSPHPANYLLEGIIKNNSAYIDVYTFDEYFDKYSYKFKISFRRQWIGQSSKSEHRRAIGLLKKSDNKPWIFDDVVGTPRKNKLGKIWRDDISKDERKTVYFLMIEKEK